MKKNLHFSSETDQWSTPQSFYDELNKEFHFTLDPCCDVTNRKCNKYFTKNENGLIQSWEGEVVFMNPPYGTEISKWVKKASEEKCLTVALLPARTDTRYFHDYIYNKTEIRFIKGRLKFGGNKNSAPFPSMIVVFNNPSPNPH